MMNIRTGRRNWTINILLANEKLLKTFQLMYNRFRKFIHHEHKLHSITTYSYMLTDYFSDSDRLCERSKSAAVRRSAFSSFWCTVCFGGWSDSLFMKWKPIISLYSPVPRQRVQCPSPLPPHILHLKQRIPQIDSTTIFH